MRIEERNDGPALIIAVKDERIDSRNAGDLNQKIRDSINAGQRWIVLDIGDVEFVDSSGLGSIVSALKLFGDDGDLLISGARQPVLALFKLTRMDKVFRLFATSAEASATAAAEALGSTQGPA